MARRLALLPAVLLAVTLVPLAVAQGSLTRTSSGRTLILYAVAEQEQFINNADDRARGEGNSPFGNYSDVVPPPVNEKSKGPYPGDEALYSFNVYTDAHLSKRAGAAVFTCQYNFHNDAFCDASYQLRSGTVVAQGDLNFAATRFSLAVTGGNGAYASAGGEIEAVPSGRQAERLTFRLERN
jgi:hypothetical protein